MNLIGIIRIIQIEKQELNYQFLIQMNRIQNTYKVIENFFQFHYLQISEKIFKALIRNMSQLKIQNRLNICKGFVNMEKKLKRLQLETDVYGQHMYIKIYFLNKLQTTDGKKQGIRKETIQNYWNKNQVYLLGEYVNDQRQGLWRYIFDGKQIGGGEYNIMYIEQHPYPLDQRIYKVLDNWQNSSLLLQVNTSYQSSAKNII
ncbi:unnamed protein product [Paramecium pentaurelia]|uniref:Uncharacterized protein n=1 Tax=Paramecium pentaurelia TaxID=43138 RepID=A0A8S1TIY4_9CILI|nr:unnamed protein product [Paramecium pentaurelia]